MKITSAELAFLTARKPSLLAQNGVTVSSPKPHRESALHKQINLECHRRGYIALHGAMNKKTHRTAGEPDFVILAPNGRTLFVEAKTGSGNLSDDQERLHGKAWTLGHKVHVVRSFFEFLDVLNMEGVK